MPNPPRSPLEGVTRLIVDGTNLLYRLAPRPAGGPAVAPAPPAAVVGRIRAAIPAAIAIELVFDGMGAGPKGRLAAGMYVRWSGRRSGDDIILDLAGVASLGPGGGPGRVVAESVAASSLVVTDDRELRSRLHLNGVRSVPLVWLVGRLDLGVAANPAIGNRRRPLPPAAADPDAEPERRWQPGRGATTKTGPARRVARHRRHPWHPPG